MISGLQIRAARGFLCWDRRELAAKAVVSVFNIERIESGNSITGRSKLASCMTAIQVVLEAAGIEFTNDGDVPGVRLHAKKKRRGK
jgi:ribosome-binding protein aMBF1 (putative translation factor)